MTESVHSARAAVIGAGVAGLSCARELAEHGFEVTVFEAYDMPGGRAATLVSDSGPYDHGAQYFTVHAPDFATAVRGWEAEGVVQRWGGRVVAFYDGYTEDKTSSIERFVAVPGMLRLGRHLSRGLTVRYHTPIEKLVRSGERWRLEGGQGLTATDGTLYDVVCVALPSTPSAALLRGLSTIAELAATVNWDPCWSAMVALPKASGADFDGAFYNDDPILGWSARDSAKPRRGSVEGVAERWVLHARPRWSRRFYQMEAAEVARWLVRSFSARLRRTLNPTMLTAVRWQFATPLNALSQTHLWDPELRVGAAGDWCNGPRIEGAYLSGIALAHAVIG